MLSESDELKLTKVIYCGNHVETVSSNITAKERKPKIYRVDKTHYVDGGTGEVKEFSPPP